MTHGAMRRSQKILLCLIPHAAAGGCGTAPSKNLPPPADQLGYSSLSAGSQQQEKLWKDFASSLGLVYKSPADPTQSAESDSGIKNADALELELDSFPSRISPSQIAATNSALIEGFTGINLANPRPLSNNSGTKSPKGTQFYGTRCARIESLTAVDTLTAHAGSPESPLGSVKIYKLAYVLEDETPAQALGLSDDAVSLGDKVVRTALLTVPTQAEGHPPRLPLVLYGHGGDQGLSYTEIARVFGDLQTRMVIAAPSFPEEAICAQEISPISGGCRGGEASTIAPPTAKGTLKPLDSDANELLGLQNCITRSMFLLHKETKIKERGLNVGVGPNDPPTEVAKLLAPLVATYEVAQGRSPATLGDALRLAEPRSIIIGSSRGAATSLIALAKAGAALQIQSQLPEGTTLSHRQ